MRTWWRRLSAPQRLLVLVGAASIASAVVVTARRDLTSRRPSEIRGDPEVWNRVTFLPGGAVAYLLAGRRQ